MVESGKGPSQQDIDKAKPHVCRAVERDDQKRLQKIFEQGFPVDEPLNLIGQTAMILFAQSLNLDGIQFLIELGADLNKQDAFGRSMIHYLVQVDKSGEATEWMIETYDDKLDLDIKTTAGVTALMLSVKRNYSKTVQALLNGRANPFTTDQLGQEAVDYAIALHNQSDATYPVKEMIELAKEQWLKQLSKEEALADQPQSDPHFSQFKDD